MFSDNYIALCARNGEYVTAVAERLGLSRSAGLKWANGSIPRKATMKRIADYFHVSAEELENGDLTAEEETDELADIRMIGRASKKMSAADREKLIQLMRIAFPKAFDD